MDDNWDGGSAHMLVNLDKGQAANGAANAAGRGGTGQEITEVNAFTLGLSLRNYPNSDLLSQPCVIFSDFTV